MKTVELVNRQRQPVGSIIWDVQGQITVQIDDQVVEAELQAFVAQMQKEGLLYRSGERVTNVDGDQFIERQTMITSGDERFPAALADAVNRRSFGGKRIFAMLKQ
ncbi:MAG: hypothetical protein OHK0022_36940 [Roseiflexaceae bacterium]